MPKTEAQKRANTKWAKKAYKRYAVNARKEFAAIVDEYCSLHGYSSSGFFLAAAKYCIENNIDLFNDSDADTK